METNKLTTTMRVYVTFERVVMNFAYWNSFGQLRFFKKSMVWLKEVNKSTTEDEWASIELIGLNFRKNSVRGCLHA